MGVVGAEKGNVKHFKGNEKEMRCGLSFLVLVQAQKLHQFENELRSLYVEVKGLLGDVWENNIKTYLKETGWDRVDYIHLAQNRGKWRAAVNPLISVRVAQHSKFYYSSNY